MPKTPSDREKSPLETIGILPAEQYQTAKKFVDLGEKLQCRTKVRYATRHKLWKCTFTMKKPSWLLYTVECDEQSFLVRARLFNIHAYIVYVDTCSERIKTAITNGLMCTQCNPDCGGRQPFTLNDSTYRYCTFCSISFSGLSGDEWENVLTLIENEYNAAISAV